MRAFRKMASALALTAMTACATTGQQSSRYVLTELALLTEDGRVATRDFSVPLPPGWSVARASTMRRWLPGGEWEDFDGLILVNSMEAGFSSVIAVMEDKQATPRPPERSWTCTNATKVKHRSGTACRTQSKKDDSLTSRSTLYTGSNVYVIACMHGADDSGIEALCKDVIDGLGPASAPWEPKTAKLIVRSGRAHTPVLSVPVPPNYGVATGAELKQLYPKELWSDQDSLWLKPWSSLRANENTIHISWEPASLTEGPALYETRTDEGCAQMGRMTAMAGLFAGLFAGDADQIEKVKLRSAEMIEHATGPVCHIDTSSAVQAHGSIGAYDWRVWCTVADQATRDACDTVIKGLGASDYDKLVGRGRK